MKTASYLNVSLVDDRCSRNPISCCQKGPKGAGGAVTGLSGRGHRLLRVWVWEGNCLSLPKGLDARLVS